MWLTLTNLLFRVIVSSKPHIWLLYKFFFNIQATNNLHGSECESLDDFNQAVRDKMNKDNKVTIMVVVSSHIDKGLFNHEMRMILFNDECYHGKPSSLQTLHLHKLHTCGKVSGVNRCEL